MEIADGGDAVRSTWFFEHLSLDQRIVFTIAAASSGPATSVPYPHVAIFPLFPIGHTRLLATTEGFSGGYRGFSPGPRWMIRTRRSGTLRRMRVNGHCRTRSLTMRYTFAALISALLLALSGAPPTDVRAQDAAPSVPLATAPEITAEAVYATDITTGIDLMALNADEPLPPASTAKMASVIVILDTLERLGISTSEPIVIDQADVTVEGESTMNLVAGDTLTIEQLLYGMLLPSGNDAARTMARYVGSLLLTEEGGTGDPIQRFVAGMNDMVAGLGLQQTRFVDPAGRQDGNVTTARELAVIARTLLGYPLLAEIVDTKAIDVVSIGPEARTYNLVNTNAMLGENGIHGVKTGTLDRGNLVITKTEHGKNRVIIVTLSSDVEYDADGFVVAGSDRRYDDMHAVLDVLDQSFQWVDPSEQDEIPGLQDDRGAHHRRWPLPVSTRTRTRRRAGESSRSRAILRRLSRGDRTTGHPTGRLTHWICRHRPPALATGRSPKGRTVIMERLQRVLAARGIASRRAAEDLIREGRVRVDGVVVTTLGTKVDPVRAKITVDGKPARPERLRYIILHKPRGFITTTNDERGRATVMELVRVPERIYPVGRLDRETEGLLLLSNDGEVANRVMHPRYQLGKEYHVLTLAQPAPETLQRVRSGVVIDGKRVVPEEFRVLRETREGLILTITIHEGIYHVIRRIMDEVGIPVERLRRVRIGPLSLAGLEPGTWRELTAGELATLQEALRLDRERPEPRTGRPLPRSAGEPVRRPRGRSGPPPVGERASAPPPPRESRRDQDRRPSRRPDRRYFDDAAGERPARPSRREPNNDQHRERKPAQPVRGRPPGGDQGERSERRGPTRPPADRDQPTRRQSRPPVGGGDRRSSGGRENDRRARSRRPPRRDLP